MPTITGQELQHANATLQAVSRFGGGAPFVFQRFKKLSYSDTVEKEAVTDKNGEQQAYTIKPEKTDGSMSTHLSEWFRFCNWLTIEAAVMGGKFGRRFGIGQVEFDLCVVYGPGAAIQKRDRLTTAMIQKDPRDTNDDQSVLVAEVPLFILGIQDGDTGDKFVEY